MVSSEFSYLSAHRLTYSNFHRRDRKDCRETYDSSQFSPVRCVR